MINNLHMQYDIQVIRSSLYCIHNFCLFTNSTQMVWYGMVNSTENNFIHILDKNKNCIKLCREYYFFQNVLHYILFITTFII